VLGFWGSVWGRGWETAAAHTEIDTDAPQMAKKSLAPVAVWDDTISDKRWMMLT
jgi:hypothetical protein